MMAAAVTSGHKAAWAVPLEGTVKRESGRAQIFEARRSGRATQMPEC